MAQSELLKKDLFGEIRLTEDAAGQRVERDSSAATPWLRWLARRLLRREARVLGALIGVEGVPQLLLADRDLLARSYLDGLPLHRQRPRDPAFFSAAMQLLRRLHRLGVVHNDLAKEPNVLVRNNSAPAFIDFQLAWFAPRRGRLFRWLAYEDLRHLLKHKRSYCPDALTQREQHILANPSFGSRTYRRTIKPLYMFITRRLLGWADREGAGDRGARL